MLFGSIETAWLSCIKPDSVNSRYIVLLLLRKNTSGTTKAETSLGMFPEGTTPGWVNGSEGLATFSYGVQAPPDSKFKAFPSNVATSPLSNISVVPSCLHVGPKV